MATPDQSGIPWSLALLPAPVRFLCSAFLIGISLAYLVALLFVFVQSDMRPSGIAEQFRGHEREILSPPGGDSEGMEASPDGPTGLAEEWKSRRGGMRFAKSLREMILTTHVHLLSISMLYFLIGGIFSATSFPTRAKIWIVGAGFGGLFGVYASMWATRYGHPALSWAVYFFGLIQTLALLVQVLTAFRELAIPVKRS